MTGLETLDPGLSEIGHEQAKLTAEHLGKVGFERLIVSPLRRTRETAAPIAERTGLEPEIRHEVSEVFDPSMPIEERRNMIGPFMASTWVEQNETLREWRARVVETLLGIGKGGQDVVVVSHYVAISVAIGAATGDDRVIPVPVGNTSITRVDVRDGELHLAGAAETGHLPAELVTGLMQATSGGG